MQKNNYLAKLITRPGRWYYSLLVILGFWVTDSFGQTSVTYNYTGAAQSFTVPAGVTTLKVECWGGGGGGGGVNPSTASGGGGGGAYSMSSTVAVTPGNTYTVTVGAGGTGTLAANGGPGGDSWFNTAGTVMAKGGNGGTLSGAAGTGGTAAASIGTTKFNGGNGANGLTGSYGGGGGGGGGTTAAGGNASTSTGGSGGVTGGGAGANGPTANNPGNPGTTPGGAGSGARTGAAQGRAGGVGGDGRVIITYTSPGCSGTPVGGTTATTANNFCAGGSFTLSLTGADAGAGISYQWQSAPDVAGAPGTFTNIGGATAATYATTEAVTTWFRCTLTCANGGASANSSNLQVVTAQCINMTNGSTTTCAANFYDSGGPSGQYGLNEDFVYTFFPNPGNNSRITWTSFVSEATFDFITIHNGPSTSSPVIYGPNSGNLSIPTLTSSDPTGALTVHFTSDFSTNKAGWVAFVSCVPLPGCSGTPTAGTTVSTQNPACISSSFTLSLSGASNLAGLTYQWQSSPNGSAWTNIVGATSFSYVTSQTVATWYRNVVTCSNGGASSPSTPLNVTVGTACNCLSYCTPTQTTGTCTSPDEFISNLTFNTINNSSTCAQSYPAGYTNYTGISTSIQQGQSYSFTLTNGGPFTGDLAHVFFDWNADGDWADAGEDITLTGSGTNNAQFWNATITVPFTATPGGTRMRARVYFTTFYGPCDEADYGEAEDYCITIATATPCSGTPAASSTLASANPACYSTPFNLSLGTTYSSGGMAYQWQSAPDVSGAPGTFTNIAGATSSAYAATQNTAKLWYHCIITCTNSTLSVTSTNLQVLSQLCYCVSAYSTGCANDKITNFVLNTLSNNSGTACVASPPGYVIYPPSPSNLTTTLTQGVTYTATITETSGNTTGMGVAIFIDYNDNGTFDASENSNSGTVKIGAGATSGSGTVQILIPAGASSGLHRMRVKAVRNTAGNVIDPCTTANANGETEDYTVTIGPQVCIASPTSPADGISICPSALGLLSWNPFSGATGYNVYFGTSNPATTLVSSNQPGTSYNPGTIAGGATYYWSVVPVGPGGTSCSTWSFTVKAGPDPLASSNAPVCAGSPLSLFGSNNDGSQINTGWSWSGPSFSSTSQNPNISSAGAANTGTYILTITNSLGCTASATTSVLVNPNPVLSIGTQTNVSCNGLSDGSVDINASSGTAPYLFDLVGPSTADGIFTGLAAGTYTATVNDDNGCAATPLTVTITEPPVLTIGAGSNGPVCEGTALNLNSTPGGGTSGYSYAWTGPNGSVPSVQNPVISSATTADGGQYDLQVTDAHSCTATASVTVVVNSAATVSAGGDQTICSGTTATMAGSFGGGAGSAIWSTSGNGTFNNNNPGAVYTPSAGDITAGSVTLTYETNDPFGPCSSTSSSMLLTISPAATVSAGGDQTICSGTTATMAGSFGGGAGSATWSTSGSGTFNNNNTNAVYTPSANDITAGSVTLTYQTNDPSGPCDPVEASMTLTIIESPTATIALTGGSDKCLGQSATVQLTFTGTGPWNYTITGSGGPYTGSTASNPANINVTPTATGTQTYTVTSVGNASCPTGGTTSGSATVNVSTVPPPSSGPVPAGAAEACVGTVMQITSNVIAGQNIIYSWNTGSNSSTVLFSTSVSGPFTTGPFTTNTNQVYVQFGALGGGQSGYQVCLQGVNGCGSSINKCLWIRGVVSGPGAITPANGVVACENTTQLYSCGISAGATIYNWTLNGSAGAVSPNGGNNPTNVSVTFPSGFTTGQLCVTAALSCGGSSTSPARCITINKNPANPNVPTGAAAVCPGATGVPYSIPAVAGATGYNWTVPANATIATGTNSASITVNFPTPYNGSSSVCVTTTSACGASAVKCKTVSSGIPNQPAGITGPLNNVCGSTVQYSVVSPVAGLTYAWTNPAGTTISGSATGSTILLAVSSGFTSGFLTVAANSALCAPATSAVRTSSTIWGRPNNPGTITQNPPGAFCSGASLNFSVVNPVTGPLPVYTWTSSNGAITSLQGPNNIDVTWGTNAAGTITVKAGNTCGLSAGTSSQVFTPNNCREEGIGTLAAIDLSVYPNPTSGKATVSFYSETSFNYTLKVIDYLGREVFSNELKAVEGDNTQEVDMSHLGKGMYLIEVAGADLSQKVKVIVQ